MSSDLGNMALAQTHRSDAALGLGGPISLGVAAILVFFGGFCGWAAFASLGSAAIAPGEVVVAGERKTIMHLEGGIVQTIHVVEGQAVEVGEKLVTLNDVQARARLEQLRFAVFSRLALQARLEAERDSRHEIAYPGMLLDESRDPRVATILQAQHAIFAARNRARIGKVRILTEQIAQSRAEIEGLTIQIDADTRQLALIEDEIVDAEALLAKGLTERPRVLALLRRQAEIEGNIGRSQAAIAQVEKAIGEIDVRIVELSTAQIAEAADRLQTVEAELNEFGERVRVADDILQRTTLNAPVAGRVIDLRVHTVGGVIGAGEAVLEIVPTNERMLVRAEIDPADIDVIETGLPAQVRMSALPYRYTRPVDGRVVLISADRFVDERSRRAYYLADIELSIPADLAGLLHPGMQAEVMIETGTRTLLDYLVEPFARATARGMRQQ